jgi:peptide/nickel transport system substrate-binding protein
VLERLDFGTDPVDGRAAILAAPEIRRALAACIDRQGILDEVVAGLSPVPTTAIGVGNPAFASTSSVSYSPATAGEQLSELGWVDDDGQPATPRIAQGVEDVPPGAPLSLSLLAAAAPSQEAVAQSIAQDLAGCGVQVEVETVPAETLFAPWPDGPVFGRGFDLVVWPWVEWITPACELFTTAEIASGTFPQGSNAAGFSDARYDAQCAAARLKPIAAGGDPAAIGEAQRLLDESLPTLPLFQWPRLIVSNSRLCGLALDSTAALLWNLEELTSEAGCLP